MPLIFIVHMACLGYSFLLTEMEESIAKATEDYPLQKGPQESGPFLFTGIFKAGFILHTPGLFSAR